ncbi:MAG: DNA repair protein RadC [Rhodospirillaceae bacterium]|nr:DNA repair protein RadC [Rhodospirillaceae bacterium]
MSTNHQDRFTSEARMVELIGPFLSAGKVNEQATAKAWKLIGRYESLRAVVALPQETLVREGLSEAQAYRVKSVMPLASAVFEDGLRDGKRAFCGSQDAADFVRAKIGLSEREVFAAAFLDTRHRLLKFEPLFFGSIDRASIFPREIVKRALELNAAAILFAHNHPSGVAEPSVSDIELTERLVSVFKELDIRVLDHLVVGGDQVISMAERGLI